MFNIKKTSHVLKPRNQIYLLLMMCNLKKTLLTFTVAGLVLLFSTNAYAFSLDSLFNFNLDKKPPKLRVINPPINQRKQPVLVKVGIYVLHVGKYDLQSGNTHIDFYLIFKCKSVCDKINFEIMNATSSHVQIAAKQKGYLVYRVQADLNKSGNLRNYPFDDHTLDIIIENRQLTNDKMIFEADPTLTALDSNLNVVGFELSPRWTATVTNHYYNVFQQTFSSYKFSIHIDRPFLAGVLKGILPALIIICCNFLALFMKIEHLSQRLGVATSTLIAAEVFHLNLTASVPPLGYATYADMFMLINYIFLLTVLAEVVITTHYIESKHHALAERINTMCAWFIPLFWLVLQIINWLAFNP